METPTHTPSKILYSWKKGLLFIRVERSFLTDGRVETVMYIPRWKSEAQKIAEQSVYWLNIVQDFEKSASHPSGWAMKQAMDRANRNSQPHEVTIYNLADESGRQKVDDLLRDKLERNSKSQGE